MAAPSRKGYGGTGDRVYGLDRDNSDSCSGFPAPCSLSLSLTETLYLRAVAADLHAAATAAAVAGRTGTEEEPGAAVAMHSRTCKTSSSRSSSVPEHATDSAIDPE